MRGTPTYDLQHLQQLVGQGPQTRRVTMVAIDGASAVGLGLEAILEAVLLLQPSHFYKSMEAEKRPGLWQDVYHLEYRRIQLCIKLQLSRDARAVVVQFKRR